MVDCVRCDAVCERVVKVIGQDGRTNTLEISVRKMPLLLLIAVALSPCAARAQTVGEFGPFQAKLAAKYGETMVRTDSSRGVQQLVVTLSDKRYRGAWETARFRDSVKAIAKYASENLPVGYHPELIIVRIVTADSVTGAVRRPEITTTIFSVAKLR